ncbi:MAG: VWA domain-containing protein [Propionibacteriaceae bacterium]|jgi:Ca-activated chloride channel family protein|nr:VWA domain-containing protein [Propionibacteriaceae bacterium]
MIPTPVGPFEFFNAARLWAMLALPLLIALYIVALHLSRRSGIRYTNTGVLRAVLPKQSQWRRHLAVAMALCSLVMICGAWARPVGVERQPRERATIVVVLDASLSMQATDVAPTRFAAEKAAAAEFIRGLPTKYNVAIVELSGSPALLCPPTTDRNTALAALDAMELSEGTAIGEALYVASNAIGQAPLGENEDTPAPGMIVLLSDGSNTVGRDPVSAAAAAAASGYRIHTIAFGTENGYVDLDGRRENVAPDHQVLREIATASNGRALDAASAGELSDAYADLGSDVGYEEIKTEVTARWAMYALAFAIVAALGAVSMAARWP